jgi:outer membrane murein-binding lipoprotein Lpp
MKRGPLLALASVLLAVLVSQVALAGGGSGSAGSRAKGSGVAKQVKTLKRQVAALQDQVNAIQGKPPPTTGPTTPSGPAGGDLTGSYPNPRIAAGAIDATKVQPGAFLEPCEPGAVAASGSWFAPSLPTDGTFVPPNRFGGELGFACAGLGLTATKLAVGNYQVKTNGLASGTLVQLVNAEPGTGQVRFASSSGPFAGDVFDVFVRDDTGTLQDPSYVSIVLIQTVPG